MHVNTRCINRFTARSAWQRVHLLGQDDMIAGQVYRVKEWAATTNEREKRRDPCFWWRRRQVTAHALKYYVKMTGARVCSRHKLLHRPSETEDFAGGSDNLLQLA